MQLTHTTGHHTVRTAIAAACLAALALLFLAGCIQALILNE